MTLVVVAALTLTLTACSSFKAKRLIGQLDSLVERLEEDGAKYTSEQWSKATAEYDEICAKMKQYEYTSEQQQEIGRLKGRYYAAYSKHALKKAGEWVDSFLDQAGEFVNGFLDGLVTYPDDDKQPATVETVEPPTDD